MTMPMCHGNPTASRERNRADIGVIRGLQSEVTVRGTNMPIRTWKMEDAPDLVSKADVVDAGGERVADGDACHGVDPGRSLGQSIRAFAVYRSRRRALLD